MTCCVLIDALRRSFYGCFIVHFVNKWRGYYDSLEGLFLKGINIEIPQALIPNLKNYSGAILLYLDKSRVVNGFPLKDNEFVTSLDNLNEAFVLAGFNSQNSDILRQ